MTAKVFGSDERLWWGTGTWTRAQVRACPLVTLVGWVPLNNCVGYYRARDRAFRQGARRFPSAVGRFLRHPPTPGPLIPVWRFVLIAPVIRRDGLQFAHLSLHDELNLDAALVRYGFDLELRWKAMTQALDLGGP